MTHISDDDHGLLRRLTQAEHEPFEGWDFSRLQGRMVEEPLTWNYDALVRQALPRAQSLLDMDTGGGERLAGWKPLPPHTVATEAYEPNVRIARARLEPLSVHVYEVDASGILPFPADMFDLITNGHGAYSPLEVLRVLRPEGNFITQQVGSRNLETLNERMAAPDTSFPDWTLDRARRELEDAGLVVTTAEEEFPVTRFRDVESIVYFLKAIPWQIPDFTIARYFDQLHVLDRQIRSGGVVEARAHRFLIVGHKPG